VVVLIIDQLNIDADKDERDTPIAIHPNRPVAFQLALERMQAK
jgi:hypothetical protein